MGLARIGLGANLGDRQTTLEAACERLAEVGRIVRRSSWYRTRPWGNADQPEFLNGAVLLETGLEPRPLLAALKQFEADLGRVAGSRWGPRAIDLDILAYDDRRIDDPDLVVPHPRLFERAFALGPLAEIDPSYAAAYQALPADARAEIDRLPQGCGRGRAKVATVVSFETALERAQAVAGACVGGNLVSLRLDDPAFAVEVRRTPRLPAAVAPPAGDGLAAPTVAPPVPPVVIRSENVGVVRFARPIFATGTAVAEGRELAFVESLGIRNPVRTARAGRVVAVHVEDGQPVDYGMPLFSLGEPEA